MNAKCRYTRGMKLLLLIILLLMILAGVIFANDAKMKERIVGTWSLGDKEDYNSRYTTFEADGTVLMGVHNYEMKWDIKDGELIETPDPDAQDRTIWPSLTSQSVKRINVFAILFLTKYELLLQDAKDKSYIFMSR